MAASADFADAALRVRTFVGRARRQRAFATALHLGAMTGLPAVFLILVALLAGVAVAGLWAWAAAAVVAAVTLGALRGYTAPADRLLGGLPAILRPRALTDELRTFGERRDQQRDPMVSWLAVVVADHLGEVPPPALRRLGRRALGAMRYLLPLCVLLLLALLLRFWAPPVPGLGGGAQGTGSGPGPGAAGGAGLETGGPPTPAPTDQPDLPEPPPPDAPPADPPPADPPPGQDPPPEDPPDQDPPPTGEPPPLLDLPHNRQFLVPQFVDDGPSRRALAQVAAVDQGTGGASQTAGGGPGGAAQPATPPTTEEFQAAAERAVRSRHVPPDERAIVRRFFQLLREERK